ncbi:MAG: archease [Thermoprotei archaeon]
MPYRYLEDVAIADLAFEAESDSLEGLFEEAAMAIFEAMANTSTLHVEGQLSFTVKAESVEDLLYKFLSEVVYFKDAEAILFKRVRVKISVDGGYTLVAQGEYDHLDPSRQELRMDVKAVTYHMFRVEKKGDGWVCTVVVDV